MTARGDHARYLLSLVWDELVRTDRTESLDEDDYHALLNELDRLYDRAAGDLAQRVHDDELARQREVRARERERGVDIDCPQCRATWRARGLDGDAGSHGEGVRRVSAEATADAVDQEVVR